MSIPFPEVAQTLDRVGLDDAYGVRLAGYLANCEDPHRKLQRCRPSIPDDDEIRAMPDDEKVIALITMVSEIVDRMDKKFYLCPDWRAEMQSAGFEALTKVNFSIARKPRNYAWKAVYLAVSRCLDELCRDDQDADETTSLFYTPEPDDSPLDSGEVADFEPINGDYVKSGEGPFEAWETILLTLRSLYAECRDEIDKAIVTKRWADGACMHGVIVPVDKIADAVGTTIDDVMERLCCLRCRWCYRINDRRRSRGHRALRISTHVSTGIVPPPSNARGEQAVLRMKPHWEDPRTPQPRRTSDFARRLKKKALEEAN